jgi:protein phosphatase
MTHGFDVTAQTFLLQSQEFQREALEFLNTLVSHLVLDGGALVVAHAGLPERYHGRSSGRVKAFCLYGETTGELDGYGLPVRVDWTHDYQGQALVVYGHYPTTTVRRTNRTIGLDTGCAFGGELSALRYPEGTVVSVKARRVYYEPTKPVPNTVFDQPLPIGCVLGGKAIETTLLGPVSIKTDQAAPALELMGRFSVDTRWLIYLPPTMSPCETSGLDDYLEYPADALSYYSYMGISKVICETKHMGSRAVVVVARDVASAKARFGVTGVAIGSIYTRMGRPFFPDQGLEETLLARLSAALTSSGFWDRMETNWVALDCELLPWSAKAGNLISDHYAPVGWAGLGGLAAAERTLESILERQDLPCEERTNLSELRERFAERQSGVKGFVDALGQYCWKTDGLNGIKLAPFQILAVEGRVPKELDHASHLGLIKEHLLHDPLFLATDNLVVDLSDPASLNSGLEFWQELTGRGGEGIVVKPLTGVFSLGEGGRNKNDRLVQPAVKCRGREYLRIIYGPEYTLPSNLARLKERTLGRKRMLAAKEYALGLEALQRFTAYAPPDKVHECVFSVLALESEPIDPRL